MQERPEQVYEVSSQAVRRELRVAVRQLRDCGLHRASAWAAEQLVGLREDDPISPTAAAALTEPEAHVNGDDSDIMLLARRFFDGKVCCAAVLKTLLIGALAFTLCVNLSATPPRMVPANAECWQLFTLTLHLLLRCRNICGQWMR